MDFIISLAHFCEVHGPTSILCTQITSNPCATCHSCVTPPSDDPPRSSFSSYNSAFDPSSPRLSERIGSLSSPFQTPPTSPRTPGSSHNPYFPSFSSDAEALRRFSGAFDTNDDACENCTFLVPETVSKRLPDGAPGSPTKDGRGRNGSPVLRTSQSVLAQGAPIHYDECDSMTDSSDAEQSKASRSFSRSPESLDSSPASPLYMQQNTHTHTLTYLTTRQPTSPSAYALLRRSCIRTLSCENLPRGSPSGPLYFGDPVAGYTIAYIFRIPDPRARGRLRTYALLALGGRDSWRVSMAMVKITEVFESIASQIVAMADKVLERESAASSLQSRPATAIPVTPPLGSSVSPGSVPQSPQKPTSSSTVSSPAKRNITPVSSFLSAKKVDPDGYPRVSRDVMRAKGLAEIVGNDNFFVELHARFCMLLSGLIKDFGS